MACCSTACSTGVSSSTGARSGTSASEVFDDPARGEMPEASPVHDAPERAETREAPIDPRAAKRAEITARWRAERNAEDGENYSRSGKPEAFGRLMLVQR